MRKVLIIVHDFPPFGGGAVIRTLKYVKYLKDSGWQPTVLTLTHKHPLVEDASLLNEIPDDIEILRTPDTKLMEALGKRRKLSGSGSDAATDTKPSLPYRILRMLKNWVLDFIYMPDRESAWIPLAKEHLSKIDIKQFDLIYTTTPPHSVGLIGLWLKQQFPNTKIPWVLDVRDAWIGNPLYTSRFFWNRMRANRKEKQIINTADKIITTTTETTTSYQARYPNLPADKFLTLTNGFDPDNFTFLPENMRADKFVITYVGSMMQTRNPQSFIQAIQELTQNNSDFAQDLEINLLGVLDPANQAMFEDEIIRPYVQMFGNRPHAEAIQALSNTVLNLHISSPAEGGRGVAPGKIYEYFASRRPILALTQEGASARMIEEIGAGIVINPNDTKIIEETLLDLYKTWKTDPNSLLVPPENIDKYNRKLITNRLAKIFDEIKV